MEYSRPPSPKMISQPLPLLLFPAELLLMISSNLNTRDVGRLALTNRFLNKLLTPELYTLGAQAKCSDTATKSCTPLHWAARHGRLSTAKLLISRGAKRNVICILSNETPLHQAVRYGHLDLVKYLFRCDLLHIKTKSSKEDEFDNSTPLCIAARWGHDDILGFLLSKSPDLLNAYCCEAGNTPLHCAVRAGHLSTMIQLLLENGAKAAVEDFYSVTPLHYAASWQPESVPLLLDAGAQVNHRDEEGQTPLFWAAERGRVDTVLQLLERGADINAVDGCKMSPLSRACAQCSVHVNTELVKTLVEKGADISSKDELGMTALHHAAREGHVEIVDILLKTGARASVRDASGENALDIAIRYNKDDKVVDLLRKNMGMISWDDMVARRGFSL
ncbi:ankyrin repeat-containing domain protein [Pyronema omphalodes]|nr:ankyrin repeat-containing domain protein [Pyronema omphalodes]